MNYTWTVCEVLRKSKLCWILRIDFWDEENDVTGIFLKRILRKVPVKSPCPVSLSRRILASIWYFAWKLSTSKKTLNVKITFSTSALRSRISNLDGPNTCMHIEKKRNETITTSRPPFFKVKGEKRFANGRDVLRNLEARLICKDNRVSSARTNIFFFNIHSAKNAVEVPPVPRVHFSAVAAVFFRSSGHCYSKKAEGRWMNDECFHRSRRIYPQIRDVDVEPRPSWTSRQAYLLEAQRLDGRGPQFGDSLGQLLPKLLDRPGDTFVDVRIALLARLYIRRCETGEGFE